MIAGFIFLRLRGILGKKTGFEDEIKSNFHQETVDANDASVEKNLNLYTISCSTKHVKHNRTPFFSNKI